MTLSNFVPPKKHAAYLMLAGSVFAFALVLLVFKIVSADSGPVLKNVNPQGTVTSSSAKITLDTEDLAKCRYSTHDSSFDSMSNNLDTPDGLDHSASLGSLNKGSYTYYVRCRDFEGNANGASAVLNFTVGDISCVGENCPTVPPVIPGGDTVAPVLSGLAPVGTTYNSYVTLAVSTNENATCRYSWYDKTYDAMTLPFSTSDQRYHTAQATLKNYGYYNYYVRCKDASNNVNQVAGKISFRYASSAPVPQVYVPPKVTTPADATPPSISGLSPSGDVNTASTTIACITDENATCKYDTSDVDYNSMANTMDGAGTKNQSKAITLAAGGRNIYYVRCADKLGNKNTSSSQISFNYIAPVKAGPVISNVTPNGGAVEQSNVSLILTTDRPADCRYSSNDADFDAMQDSFSTNDGLLQQAIVSLGEYRPYVYYVRCRDHDGNVDDRSVVINFEYKNPNENRTTEPSIPNVEPTTTEPVACAEVKTGDKDGVCDKTIDCICDPDCPATGDDADSDCVTPTPPNNGWIAIVLIGLILLIIVIIIIVIIKRRSSDNEEDVELP